ncbi:MAG: sigma-70 family RNA polymerase sigma factor [Candidatus Brocadiia bacterium]
MAAKGQSEFREIAAELLYTPLRMRCAHLARLERLIPELVPDRMYTYEYIFHRITLFNPDSNGMAVFPGRALICGLCGVLRDLSRKAPLEVPATNGADDDAVLPLRAAAAECGVSPNTVWRWGAAGLPISFCVLPDRSRTWGVRRAALKKFLASRPSRAARPIKRITEEQRRALLAEAHELAGQNVPRPEIVRRLAEGTGLPAASIRRLLRQERSPAGDSDGRLSADCEEMVRLYRSGIPVHDIARRFSRTPASIYRSLHQALMEMVLSFRVKYIPNPVFAAPEADEICLGAEKLFTYPPEPPPDMLAAPEGIPPYLAELYGIPLLSREREKELFRKYNYIKYRAAMLQETIRRTGYRTGMLERFEELKEAAAQIRRILIRCNLRLVVSIAKRHIGPLAALSDLTSEGNLCLIRAVECYDFSREARFATYATWALTKHFARVVPEENYRMSAFVTGQQARLDAAGDARETSYERTELTEHIRAVLDRAIVHLTERERAIIASRFGTRGQPAKTLEEIGQLIGLTRERVRQIEARALEKLRAAIGPEAIEGVT